MNDLTGNLKQIQQPRSDCNNQGVKIMSSKIVQRAKAATNSIAKTLSPIFLETHFPGYGLGPISQIWWNYKDERDLQILTELMSKLEDRVENLSQRLNAVDETISIKIMSILDKLTQNGTEADDRRISFCAAVITGLLNSPECTQTEDLHKRFLDVILSLSNTELNLLHAIYNHNRGKGGRTLKVSNKGATWLDGSITITPTTLAWIDQLIQKVLLEDASFEEESGSKLISTSTTIRSRSAIKLTMFAREMIEYLESTQNNA